MSILTRGNHDRISLHRLSAMLVALIVACPQRSHAADTPVASEPAPNHDVAARGPSLEAALGAARVALDTCRAKGFAVSVSIIDAAGVSKVLLAGDGALLRGVRSSASKALTALTFKDATSRLGVRSQNDKSLAEAIAADANYTARAGGILLTVNDEVIGAIGVGGARPSEVDELCALAALDSVRKQSK
jgi:uncharacterized protein GlcG (DUF336 family)